MTAIQNDSRFFSFKRNIWKQRRDFQTADKGLQHTKVIVPSTINHLSRNRAVYSRPFCCVQQQEFEYPGSYKIGASKISSWTKSQVPNCLAWKENKQNSDCQSGLFSRQSSLFSSHQALKLADFKIRLCGHWIFTVNTDQQLPCKNADVKDIYFASLKLLVCRQLWFWIKMPEPKWERRLDLFQNMNVINCKDPNRRVVLLMGLWAL